MLTLNTPLSNIPGIGTKKKQYFEKIGCLNIPSLLFYFPRKYLDRRFVKKISEVSIDEVVSLKGEIVACGEQKIKRLKIINFAFSDGTGTLYLTFFNQEYLKQMLPVGTKVFVYGKIKEFKKNLQIQNPLYEIMDNKKRFNYILPIYSLVSGLTQNNIRKAISYVFLHLSEFPQDILPLPDRMDLNLSNMKFAIKNIHFPQNEVDLDKARKHLIFDEFFKLQVKLLYQKKILQHPEEQFLSVEKIDKTLVDEFEKKLPFSLTGAQKKVLNEIIDDIREGKIINRLIQGDVGSGKTVIAVFLLYFWAQQNFQSVFLAPTEILAEQHYLNWQPFFMQNNIETVLLVGSLPLKTKKQIIEKINNKDFLVIFGTHALLNEKISYPFLKAVVIDEQHKFGVEQRETFRHKENKIHFLMMSATPIPRSIALTFFGNTDISTLSEIPKGERKVITFFFKKEEKEKVYGFIEEQLSGNKQGYFVAPAIEEREGFSSVKKEYDHLKEIFNSFSIGLLHGKLSYEEKNLIVDKFKKKEIQLIISTSIIEVGIDIPSANFIIIDQAEKFGLSQLHQLRGRVGREGQISYCLLIAHCQEKDILDRLESFLAIDDGLKLAEIDLSLRGPGDLLGVRQHGVIPFKIGDIVKDIEILQQTRTLAEKIINNNIYLKPGYEKLKNYLEISK
jgi:ATP-dependent DNA helicase RecG